MAESTSSSTAAAASQASSQSSTEKKEETQTTEKGKTTVTLQWPTITIPDVIDAETDNILIPENVPKFAEFVAKIPTLPADIIKVCPGELPFKKWMARFEAMVTEVQKMVSEYIEKQQALIKKKAGLEEQLKKEGTTNDARKKIEEELAKVNEELGVIADVIDMYNEILDLINQVKKKLEELKDKVKEWVIEKIAELCKLPPFIQFWIKILSGPLIKFAKGEVSLPGPDPKEIVDWLDENVIQPIKDLATTTFKPPLKVLQSFIDFVNSYTEHPHSCQWSFAFWSDIPPEMLKSESVQKMIPDKLKPPVNRIIDAAVKADEAYEKAEKEKEKA